MECAICQDELSQYVAKPTGCTHYFHEYCLSKWKFKTCPSCRSKYDVFDVVDLEKNMVLTRITAMSPNREDLEAIQDDFPVGIPDPFIDLVCDVCNSGHDEHTLLICDGCSKGFHLNCVQLTRVPRTRSWYCVGCEPVLRRPPPQERHRNRRIMPNFIYDGHDSANDEENEESELEDEFDEEDSDRSEGSLGSFIDDQFASGDEEDSVLLSNVIDMILPTVGRRARGSRRASSSGRGARRGGTRRRRTTTRRTRRRTGATGSGRRGTRRATRGRRTVSGGQTTMDEFFRPHNAAVDENIDLMDVLPTIREEVRIKKEEVRDIVDSYDLLGEILPQQEIALTPGHLLKIEGEKFVPRPEWNSYIEKKRNKHDKSAVASIRSLPPPPANVFTVTLVSAAGSNQNDDKNGNTSSNLESSSMETSRSNSEEKRQKRQRDESNIPQTSHSSRRNSPPRKQARSSFLSSTSDRTRDQCISESRPSTSKSSADTSERRQKTADYKASKTRQNEDRNEFRKHSSREGSDRSKSEVITDKSSMEEKEEKRRSNHSNGDDDRRLAAKRSSLETTRDANRTRDRRDDDRRNNDRNKSDTVERQDSAQQNTDEQHLHQMAMIQIELNRKIEAEQHMLAMNQIAALQEGFETGNPGGVNRVDSEKVRKEKQELINFYDSIGKPEMKKLFQTKRITGDQYKNAMRLIVEKCRAKAVPLNDSEQVRHIVRKVREKILRPAKSPS